MAAPRLIVNADDFGFTAGVNDGILEAHQRGILTAATLLAGGAAFAHAVELARANPTLDVGCHLALVGFRSVRPPQRELPRTVRQLLWDVLRDPSWIEPELEAQVKMILRAGLQPSHLDTHKHTHLAPPVLEAVCRISERYSIPWVRRPFDLPLVAAASPVTRAVNAGLQRLGGRFDRTLAQHQCRTTDHFAGFQWTGEYGARELAALIRALPAGLTEFMCHPGRCDAELRGARTRLKESRERELAVLTSPEVRQAVAEGGVELVSYTSSMQSP
ncbi:MAG TPA: ChbG/HpnK family deacetylase [Bryobacterales bacterium]|nr:ChbG/HpnK family deacetylase [Bryobacterales bacterium]